MGLTFIEKLKDGLIPFGGGEIRTVTLCQLDREESKGLMHGAGSKAICLLRG